MLSCNMFKLQVSICPSALADTICPFPSACNVHSLLDMKYLNGPTSSMFSNLSIHYLLLLTELHCFLRSSGPGQGSDAPGEKLLRYAAPATICGMLACQAITNDNRLLLKGLPRAREVPTVWLL